MKRIAAVTAVAAALAASMAYAPAASASNVAWNVTIGGPGFAVSAGQPGYWRGGYGYRVGYGGWYRPWYRPAAPIYVAPRPVYVVPRPVFVPRPVYYGYGIR